jgi:ribosome biogenesis GTPase
VLVGDIVEFNPVDERKSLGVVEGVVPRKNKLTRPPVANVDQALIVLAADFPQPDLWLLDRLLVMIRAEDIKPLICWNKEDLAGDGEIRALMAPYEEAGFTQLVTCALTGLGVSSLGSLLEGKTTVLAGPSGVGKSSLINLIEPGIALKTGEISDRLGRGKHTTRHVQWIPLGIGGWVADTPGFSQTYMPDHVFSNDLMDYYAEFLPFEGDCHFRSCVHDQEDHCGVSAAVHEGKLDEGRYRRYLTFLEELREREKKHPEVFKDQS